MKTIQLSANPLGRPIRRHAVTFASTWGMFFGGLFLLALGLTLCTGLTAFVSGPKGKAVELLATIPFGHHLPFIIKTCLLLTGTLCMIRAWQNWPLIVDLYEGGMIYNDRRGTWRIPWNEVESLHLHVGRHCYCGFISAGIQYSAKMSFYRGGMLRFDGRLNEIEQLCIDLETLLKRARQSERGFGLG